MQQVAIASKVFGDLVRRVTDVIDIYNYTKHVKTKKPGRRRVTNYESLFSFNKLLLVDRAMGKEKRNLLFGATYLFFKKKKMTLSTDTMKAAEINTLLHV